MQAISPTEPKRMESRIPVSAYLITQDEEANIAEVLKQLVAFDEVVLVDSGSRDRTLAIAQGFRNVCIYYRKWSGFSDQKAYALSLCRNKWVLNLDADERLTPEYLKELRTLITQDEYDALCSRRILYRHGRKPRNFMKDDMLIRLFRKSCGHYTPAKVHEKISITGKVKHSDAALLHHENLSYAERVSKSNNYSQLRAEERFNAHKKCSLLQLYLVFPWSFFQCYIIKGCILDGSEGLLTSMNHAYYSFMKYAKLWEMNQAADRRQLKPLASNRKLHVGVSE
jgi:glycosyltransferase involved in cell wall biosynthesis